MTRLEDEPLGWRELCSKLKTAKSAEEFQIILDQINRLLTAHEKTHAALPTHKVPLPVTKLRKNSPPQ